MRTTMIIRTAVAGAAALALSMSVPARAQSQNRQQKGSAQTQQGTMQGQQGTTQTKVPKSVQQDLEKLHAANQSQIQAAQLAEQRAESPEVKQLAQTIAQQHQQADQQLQQWAQQQNVNLEGSTYQKQIKDHQAKANKNLGNKQGEAFDRAYTNQMVQDHQQDLKAVPQWTRDAQKAGDTELVSLLENNRTIMQQHLQLSQQAQAAERREASTNKGQRGPATGGTGTGGAGSQPGQSGSNQHHR